MLKIGFHIEKGGTGKTTLAGNTGFVMSAYKNTVLVDCDPQGNLTGWYCTGPLNYELADVMQGRADIKQTAVRIRKNLDILPTFAIDGSLKNWGETTLFQKPFAFLDLMDKLAAAGMPLSYLATWRDVLDECRRTKHYDDETLAQVEAFLNAPLQWSAEHGGISILPDRE
jgi:hypothetical protein